MVEFVVGGDLGWLGVHLGHSQVFNLDRSLADFSPEHLMCNQSLQCEHCTEVAASFLWQMGQMYTEPWRGPGFCSIPAMRRSSRMRQAGNTSDFVELVKNTLQRRSLCRS